MSKQGYNAKIYEGDYFISTADDQKIYKNIINNDCANPESRWRETTALV